MLIYAFCFLKEEEKIEVGYRQAWNVETATNFLLDADYKVSHTEENDGVVVLTVEQKPPAEEESLVIPISSTIFIVGQHPKYSDEPSAKELLKVLENELKNEEDKKIEVIDDSDTSPDSREESEEQDSSPKTETICKESPEEK